jgi:hypothetical protein
MEEIKANKKESGGENVVQAVFEKIFGKENSGLAGWEKTERAQKALLESPELISQDLGKEFIHHVIQGIEYPDPETKTRIIKEAEDMAYLYYPELAKTHGGVHMDAIEDLYRKHKKEY